MMRQAPRIATALLARLGPPDDALLGDLHEEYHRGQSRAWFWRQALTAIVLTGGQDVREHWVLAIRAVALGWLTLIGFIGLLGPALNHEIGDRVLDWLIVQYGSRDIPMLWATHYQFWLLLWTSHIFSGWTIARLHRRLPTAALLAFTLTVMVQMAGNAIERATAPPNSYWAHWTPFSPTLFWIETFLSPALILVGGYFGAGSRKAARPPVSELHTRQP